VQCCEKRGRTTREEEIADDIWAEYLYCYIRWIKASWLYKYIHKT
jgi:hypothetical protein